MDDFSEFGRDMGFADGHGSEPLDALDDGRVEGLAVFFRFKGAEEWD